VVAGDFSAELAADTENGIYIGLSDDPTATTKVAKRRIKGSIDPRWFGAEINMDSILGIDGAIDYIGTHGGGTVRVSGSYIYNKARDIDYDYVTICGTDKEKDKIIRTDVAVSGFTFFWAANNDTEGGGLHDITLSGVTNPDTGNAGVSFGGSVHYANSWTANNVDCESFGQFGFGISNGNNWSCSNIRVTDHGHTTTAISSCIGFYVFPRLVSSGGILNNISSEISVDSTANSAAMKLQVHANLTGENFFAKGGTEQCVSIDAISGVLSKITARAVTSNAGLAFGNFNNAHAFRGEFIIDGIDCDDSGFSQSLVIPSQLPSDTEPKLRNCTIRNVKAKDFRVLNRSAWQGCTFDNVECSGVFRLDHALAGVIVNTVAITGNKYSACSGALALNMKGDSSTYSAVYGKASSLRGDNNTVNGWTDAGSGDNAVVINGDDNVLAGVLSRDAVGRKIWIQTGDANVFQGLTVNGLALLDNGTNTNITGLTQV
jgi:hypothetical protein